MLKEINIKLYNEFIKTSEQAHFLNNYEYMQMRQLMGWECQILGCYDQKQLIAVMILHRKKLPKIKQYMYYIPKGPIIDYNNQLYLAQFTRDIKAYLKDHHGYMLRIDPELPAYINDQRNPIIDILQQLGYKHLGFVNNFEGTQPRCTIINDFKQKTYQDVYNNYERRCQKHIKNAQEAGIEIIQGDINDLDTFMEIMNDTATRGGYITRSKEYFSLILNNYQDKAQVYFAFLNPQNIDFKNKLEVINKLQAEIKALNISNQSAETSKKAVKKNNAKIKQLENQLQKLIKNYTLLEDVAQNYPQGIYLSCAIYIIDHNKAWYWYGGSKTLYRELNPVYLMFDTYIKFLIEHQIKSFDLLGISGNINNPQDKNYGLYQFKKSFGGEVKEFVGEFDLVINPFIYKIANRLLQLAQSSHQSPLLKTLLKVINNS